MEIRTIKPPGRVRKHSYDGNGDDTSQFKYYTEKNFDSIPQMQQLPEEMRLEMKVVSRVLPFKVNSYVINELIDWSDVPDDPMFQLTFPQRGMLDESDFQAVLELVSNNAPREQLKIEIERIRRGLNPHPAGQQTLNVPLIDGEVIPGLQHKYRETVLFFPAAGQTCHSYCTFCFRWAQFVGLQDLRFAAKEATQLKDYLVAHPEVTNVLFTGGDPMVMKSAKFWQYLEPLLDPWLDTIHTIRIGTKSPAFWPHRFVNDPDADDILRMFEKIVKSGRSLAIMAHYSHYKELDTPVAREAVRRIQDTGAIIRSQSPILRHINDSPAVWEMMWREQVRLGIVPYYMFVERDTGAKEYFKIPLARAVKIYREAFRHLNGLGRTVRGPSMSATPGKVEIVGITKIGDEKVFVLRFLQGRNPEWVGKPFFARWSETASWLDELEPALGTEKFFFEDELEDMSRQKLEKIGLEE